MVNSTRVLVDTCVLLDDPDVLVRIRQRGGLPFLTSTVLDELDYNKPGDGQINKNARMIFREFNSAPPSKLTSLPTGESLLGQDLLTQFSFRDGPVFLVARDDFRSRSNNDAKIIELAKDYRMVLITRDGGMKVRAEALGVDVAFWTGPEDANQRRTSANGQRRGPTRNSGSTPPNPVRQDPSPFLLCNVPVKEADSQLSVGKIPETGDAVKLSGGYEFRLGALISAGGEGSIYETQLAGQVCKIYHSNKLTRLKQRKIELMASRKIDRPGICWPSEIVINSTGEFVGYIMPRANGITMQTAMFVKPRLEKTFPKWVRRDLVNVAGTFIDHICYLHSLNIVVGDINPLNLLVTEDSTKVWIVDTDSFQIEGFPCPVGTINFTPTEIQGKNYAEFLRTKEHELFAVATMIFMILLPGKPPYSQQGGGSPADNIKSKNFPYHFIKDPSKDLPEVSGKNAPKGSWQFIWGNLPMALREAFFSSFREDKRVNVEEWTRLLIDYRDQIDAGYSSNDLFPLGFVVRDPVQICCAKCSISFTASERWVEKLSSENKPVWCPTCANRVRIERLAAQSKRTTEQATGQFSGNTQRASSGPVWQKTTTTRPSGHQQRGTQSNSSNNTYNSQRQHYPQSVPSTGKSGGLLGSLLRFIFK